MNTNNNNSSIANINNSSIANNNLNTNSARTASGKENTPMNRFTTLLRRAATCVGLAALLTFAHAAAKADVMVDDWIQPSHDTLVKAGTTDLQLKLYNDDSYGVSGVKAHVTFWLGEHFGGIVIPINGTQSTVYSNAVSMTPYQDAWVNVVIPHQGPNKASYIGKTLYATISSGSDTFTIHFVDEAPSADVQMEQITPPSNDNAGTHFTVKVSNTGYFTSKAETITGQLYANAEGRVSPYYALSGSVPILKPGQSCIVTFTMPKIVTYDNTGYSDIKGELTLGKQTLNFDF